VEAEFRHGAWWGRIDEDGVGPFSVSAEWDSGAVVTESVPILIPVAIPPVETIPVSEGLQIRWPSRAGFLYSIEHSDDLRNWTAGAGGRRHFGTGEWLDDVDEATPGEPRGFSRLKIMRVNE